ncbi:unnamed protein product, partial [Allacma fusca]
PSLGHSVSLIKLSKYEDKQ